MEICLNYRLYKFVLQYRLSFMCIFTLNTVTRFYVRLVDILPPRLWSSQRISALHDRSSSSSSKGFPSFINNIFISVNFAPVFTEPEINWHTKNEMSDVDLFPQKFFPFLLTIFWLIMNSIQVCCSIDNWMTAHSNFTYDSVTWT